MKKLVFIVVGVVVVFIIGGLLFYFQNLSGIWPAIRPPGEDITKSIPAAGDTSTSSPALPNTTSFPLKLPPGFSISIFAKDLPGARVMQFDTFGNLWVSQTSEGKVSLIEIDGGSGRVVRHSPIFTNLRKPHGLAFDPENPFTLYYAEENKISRITVYSDDTPQKIVDLPATGEHHFTRTIGFGSDGRLYVSIGSSCNVCHEEDSRRAKIFSMKKDGSDFKEFARGLRNAVFFVWHPKTGEMWATEMGRDLLGDDLPPDEINVIQNSVLNFGWPICYGKNIHDTDFDKNTYIRNPCMEPFEIPSYIDIPAHSAPLGLAFIPPNQSKLGTGQAAQPEWPKEYWHNLLVAYHGSWNRTEPTGYKVVRFKLDEQGNILSPQAEDFITGWLTEDGALGRPADIVIHDGAIYISDDKAGVIYKVQHALQR